MGFFQYALSVTVCDVIAPRRARFAHSRRGAYKTRPCRADVRNNAEHPPIAASPGHRGASDDRCVPLCGAVRSAQCAVAAQPLPAWNRTEIISNDPLLIEQARRVNLVEEGDLIALNDPRLKNNCEQVRAAIPQHQVACTAILNGNNRYISRRVREHRQRAYLLFVSAQSAVTAVPRCVTRQIFCAGRRRAKL